VPAQGDQLAAVATTATCIPRRARTRS
jgi:hypothetical protein